MRRVVAAVAFRGGRVLIARRRGEDEMGGLWEFPGGTVREGEGEEECLIREIEEELGVTPKISGFLGEFTSPRDEITLSAYIVELPSGEYSLKAHDEIRWVEVRNLVRYEMPEVDRDVVERLLSNSKLFNTLSK